MPEFMSNLFQYRSDYIWCNNKMDDDFFRFFICFIQTSRHLHPTIFHHMFSRKINQLTQKKSFLFFYCFFWKKILYEKSRENLFFNQDFRKNKILHCTAVFSRKRIKSFKRGFFYWMCVFHEYNMVVRKFIFNQDFRHILTWPPYVFTKKSFLFICCIVFFVKTLWLDIKI